LDTSLSALKIILNGGYSEVAADIKGWGWATPE